METWSQADGRERGRGGGASRRPDLLEAPGAPSEVAEILGKGREGWSCLWGLQGPLNPPGPRPCPQSISVAGTPSRARWDEGVWGLPRGWRGTEQSQGSGENEEELGEMEN